MPCPYNEQTIKTMNAQLSTFNFQLSTIPWHWDKVAKENPFFAQLWAPLHDAKEDNSYGPESFEGWEK